MPRSVLVAAYVAWPVGVVVLRLVAKARARSMIFTAVGYLVALVVGTTATPTSVGVPLGLVIGAVAAVICCLSTGHGITFNFDPDTTYWEYDGKIPVGDRLVEILAGLVAVFGGVALPWN